MELFPSEAKKLETMVTNWLPQPNRELEATFGKGGQVDQTRFMAVVQRLKSKGYQEEPPVDYLTITIKDTMSTVNVRRDTLKANTRFTIKGTDDVRRYCRQESLDGISTTVILKTATGNPDEDDLQIEDYEMKFKVRREEERSNKEAIVNEIKSTWATQKKAFRLIRRWTFKGDGCVFDLSMVRSSKRNESGAYVFTETFGSSNYNILTQPPTYEVEVELKHADGLDTKTAMTRLVKAVGEILRGLQRSSVLIRKSQKESALSSYKALVKSDLFRGVKPRTLEMKNFVAKKIPNTPNIREGYNVTDKADGLRVLGYCNENGELFMIDKALNVYRTGLKNEACKNSLVDGEWITNVKDEKNPKVQRSTSQLLLFDIYIAPDNKVVDKLPFYEFEPAAKTRFNELSQWVKLWNTGGPATVVLGVTAKNRLIVSMKLFEFARKGKEIFDKAARVLRRATDYNTDGLIFTSNSMPLPPADSNFREQFKWKPSEDNTIDFLVRFEKDPNTGEDLVDASIHPDTGLAVKYKTLILKVGSTTNPMCVDPRKTVLFREESEYPKGGCRTDRFYQDEKGKYRAVPFNPSDYPDPMASVCRVEISKDLDTQVEYIATERTNEPIEDRSIVEMRFDMKRSEGWRWIPIRVRADKTEKFLQGKLSGSLNADFTAEAVWNSIHNPITRGMISTGNEAPLASELQAEDEDDERLLDLKKSYFNRKANKEQLRSVEGMRNFHKHGIKGETLLKSVLKEGNKSLLDLAVGEAADINRWIVNRVSFVYGIDIARKGIVDAHRGAYAKYLNRVSENLGLPESERIVIPPMIFGIGDVSKSLASGEAGEVEEEKDILRSVFGKILPQGPVPPYVTREGEGKLKDGADVIACMFALHYFFKSKETLQAFLKNVEANLKLGGYFVACFFDGQKVFDLLKGKKVGDSETGLDRNTQLWRITKEYDLSILPSDDTGFGLPILNEFISIGSAHREYLVPFELLEDKMKEIGCELVKPSELAELGLPASTETFDATYKKLVKEAKDKGQDLFPMIPSVAKYSFLNRWCIFKRYKDANVGEEEEAVEVAVTKTVVEAPAAPDNSVAWKGVPSSGDAGPVSIVAPPKKEIKATGAIEELRVNLTVPKKAANGAKGVNSLATAMVQGVTVGLQPSDRLYELDEIFGFGPTQPETKILLDDSGKPVYKNAGVYLAPFYPFEIIDKEDKNNPVTYPSLLHYVTAMEYKLATSDPSQARAFSKEGFIHTKAVTAIMGLKGTADEIEKKKVEIWRKEAEEVLAQNPQRQFQDKAIQYRPDEWFKQREKIWKHAYEARFDKDKPFKVILQKLRDLSKTLVYVTDKPHITDLDLNGELKRKGRGKTAKIQIEGKNKLGNLLMQIAEFPGYKIETELEEEE